MLHDSDTLLSVCNSDTIAFRGCYRFCLRKKLSVLAGTVIDRYQVESDRDNTRLQQTLPAVDAAFIRFHGYDKRKKVVTTDL